jgi:hypothetical protein
MLHSLAPTRGGVDRVVVPDSERPCAACRDRTVRDLQDRGDTVGLLHAFHGIEERRFNPEWLASLTDSTRLDFWMEFSKGARERFDAWLDISRNACELFGHPSFGPDTWGLLWGSILDALSRSDEWEGRLEAERQRQPDLDDESLEKVLLFRTPLSDVVSTLRATILEQRRTDGRRTDDDKSHDNDFITMKEACCSSGLLKSRLSRLGSSGVIRTNGIKGKGRRFHAADLARYMAHQAKDDDAGK